MLEKPGDDDMSLREVDMAASEKGELSPNDLDSEVDRAGCRSGDMG